MGKNTEPPMCRNCGEAHWRQPGVCPKFRSPKKIAQPKPLLLTGPKPKKGRDVPAVRKGKKP